MHEQQRNPRSLSDISHLFLSSVRERQTGAAPRPQRTPPPKSEQRDADLTPQEFQHVLNEGPQASGESAAVPPVRAVIASHLGSRQFDAVRSYARSLAASGRRVGLIWIDVSEFSLMTYEPDERLQERNQDNDGAWLDARVMREATGSQVATYLNTLANPPKPNPSP